MSKNISFCIYNISKLDEEGCFERLNQYKTDILPRVGEKIKLIQYKSDKIRHFNVEKVEHIVHDLDSDDYHFFYSVYVRE